jgi:hypothetical protein
MARATDADGIFQIGPEHRKSPPINTGTERAMVSWAIESYW